ncbi:MAG: YitT family protein, partial [Proteobacteria bacterium]|nr:YitT family protein [Pseudomonadota bacterium]
MPSNTIRKESVRLFTLTLGILSASLGLKGFLLSAHFIDGGVTGISMLVAQLTDFPLSIIIALVNLPFIILGYRQIGKKFAYKSAIAILGLAFALAFINFPFITADKLLISVFGGFFIGAGIGLAIRGGAV